MKVYLYQTCKKTKIIPKTNKITQGKSQIMHISNEMEVKSSSDNCVPLSNMRKRTKKIKKEKLYKVHDPKLHIILMNKII